MDSDTIETNLNTLKEQILDEQKLVTYVSLSKDLCIHVNESKRLLVRFVEDLRKQQSDVDLNVSYIVSGITNENKARTTVSSEKDIQEITNALKNIFFQHIYSVSKGPSNVDNVALLTVNRFEDLPLCTGLIKSNLCVKRSPSELGSLKSNSQVSLQTEQKPVSLQHKKLKEEKKDERNCTGTTEKVVKVQESKSEPSIKTEIPSPKKESSNKKVENNKKNGIKSQKGIAGFFSKSNSAPSKVVSKLTTEIKDEDSVKKKENGVKESIQVKEEAMDVDVEIEEEEIKVKNKTPSKTKSEIKKEKEVKAERNQEAKVNLEVKKESNGKSKNKSLKEIKKTAKVDKKRKRVLCVSDSESEEDKDPFADDPKPEEEESEDEIPPTPAMNTVKITSGIINPKKRRKLIDKTYTDESGYIITKKEEVYESCSDNEENVQANVKENVQAPPPVNIIKKETSPNDKKKAPKNPKKKISPPQKGKQATLMNFFKKV